MSKHGHKKHHDKHHGKKEDKKFEPQVQSPDQKQQVDKAAEHEPQAAKPANSGLAASPLSPGIPATEPNPPKEAKDDEAQQLSEGGAQGEVPDDQDQKLFKAIKTLAPALKTFKESLEGNTHLDEDTKRLLDAAHKILGKMDPEHVGDVSNAPKPAEFTGDLDKQAKDEGKASTSDQALIKDQGKNVEETGSNDGKVGEDGKVSDTPMGPAPSTPAKDLEPAQETTPESAAPAVKDDGMAPAQVD